VRAGLPFLAPSVRQRSRGQSVLVALGLMGCLVLLIAVLVGLAYAGPRGELAPGTRIAGVDVGGLTRAEAIARLERRFGKVQNEPIAFRAAGTTFSFAADQLGVEPDWRAAVAAAARAEDGFGPVRGFRRLHARFFGAEVLPPVAVSNGALEFALDRIGRIVDVTPTNAALVRRGLEIETIPEGMGRRLDRQSAARLVVSELGSLERSQEAVELPVVTVPPTVTAVMLAPAAEHARVAFSAPVILRSAHRSVRLRPLQIARLLSLPRAGASRLAIAGRAADDYFRNLARAVALPPRNAGFAAAGEQINVIPSRRGAELDVPATAHVLLRTATSPTGRTGRLVMRKVDPKRNTAAVLAMGIDQRMSTYKTYDAGTTDRITNLRLGVQALDGTLVPPGGTFSLNATIGKRTEARGFRPAPVIVGTQYSEEVGGGTSQVATTTFNAAWEAGLEITERNPHSLYISRYPLGRDATVYWPSLDLTFLNDTAHWVLVKGYAESDGIRVSIYGGERRRVVSSPGTMRVTGPVPVKRVKDPGLPKGEKIVEQEGEPPRATSVTRTVYGADGGLLRTETWNTSYKAEDRIIRVGTKSNKTKAKGSSKSPKVSVPSPAESRTTPKTSPP
jgi:vancomycin resistance protein YoaR